MPQTTPERRARWPGGDQEAWAFLKSRGFTDDHYLIQWPGREPDEREMDAIIYLCEEWDWEYAGAPKPATGHLNWFECEECGFDSAEAKAMTRLDRCICMMCAADTGREVFMKIRPATPEELRAAGLLPS